MSKENSSAEFNIPHRLSAEVIPSRHLICPAAGGPPPSFLACLKNKDASHDDGQPHFDGTVVIPDESLDLPPNQTLTVRIEPVGGKRESAEGSVLSWLAANAVESDALPADLAARHDHYLYGRSKEQR